MNKLSERSVAAFRARLVAWYARHKRAMPWRGTRDAYRVWVSEVMLQQTRVAAVLPYYRRFLRRFPTVRALAGARSEEVLKLWAGLGYYSRARNLHRAAKEMVAKHGGKFPREAEAALALPGVGRYTAAAVLSIAYGAPLAVLDGNVARVLARLGGMRGDVRAPGKWRKLEERAQELMGEEKTKIEKRKTEIEIRNSKFENRHSNTEERESNYRSRRDLFNKLRANAGATEPGEWNQAMMELGATLCTPRAPRCEECPVARWCKAYKLGIAEQVPAARKKRAVVRVEIAAAVLVDARGRTLLVKPEQAETNGLFSGMWQFPAVEVKRVALRFRSGQASGEWPFGFAQDKRVASDEKNVEEWKCGNVEVTKAKGAWVELGAVRHSVTFREITLRPFVVRVDELPRLEGARVVRLDELCAKQNAGAAPGRYIPAISSATRKIARAAILASVEKARRIGAARR